MTDRRPHIVVVEDEAAQRHLLVEYLGKHNFRVTGVDGGPALRRLVERELPAVVLLDVGLSGEDGFVLARWLRARSSATSPWAARTCCHCSPRRRCSGRRAPIFTNGRSTGACGRRSVIRASPGEHATQGLPTFCGSTRSRSDGKRYFATLPYSVRPPPSVTGSTPLRSCRASAPALAA